MFKISILSSLLACTLLFNGCSSDETTQNDANSMLSTNEFVLTALTQTQYVVEAKDDGFILQGSDDKVILLDIFATWCPPCQAEASHLTSLQKKYPDDLLIMGITVEDGINNAKLEEFRHEFDANYVLVNSQENSRLITAVAKKLNIGRNFGIPLMALYKNGKLINYYQGATEEEFIESDIKKALGK